MPVHPLRVVPGSAPGPPGAAGGGGVRPDLPRAAAGQPARLPLGESARGCWDIGE